MLVGPKGAGKSTVGRALQGRGLGTFVDSEAIALDVFARHGEVTDVYAHEAMAAIDRALTKALDAPEDLIVETTGAGPSAAELVRRITRARPTLVVRLAVSADTARRRRHARTTPQVPVSEALAERMHAASEAFAWDWDLQLDTDELSAEACTEAIATATG